MKVVVKNSKLLEVLKKRQDILNITNGLLEERTKIEKELMKHGYKMDALKEKTKLIMDSINPELKEFEFVARVYLDKDEACYDIEDMVEEYKKMVREEKSKKK